jgi:hypothetical protein
VRFDVTVLAWRKYATVFMEHFEEIAVDTADYKPVKCLRYMDDTFVVWPCGPAKL